MKKINARRLEEDAKLRQRAEQRRSRRCFCAVQLPTRRDEMTKCDWPVLLQRQGKEFRIPWVSNISRVDPAGGCSEKIGYDLDYYYCCYGSSVVVV